MGESPLENQFTLKRRVGGPSRKMPQEKGRKKTAGGESRTAGVVGGDRKAREKIHERDSEGRRKAIKIEKRKRN